MVEFHLSRGLPKDSRDSLGNSPLMIAAQHGHFAICEMLLRAGVDVEHQNNLGVCASDLAQGQKLLELLASYRHPLPLAEQEPGVVPVDDSATEVEVETEPPEAEVTMDFMLWEAEVESKPAEDNLTLRHASAEAQQLLSRYRPKDDSAEWNDIELTLPDPRRQFLTPRNIILISQRCSLAHWIRGVSLRVTSVLPEKRILVCSGLNFRPVLRH